VSIVPENPGNLLEFEIPPENTGSLLEFFDASGKFYN